MEDTFDKKYEHIMEMLGELENKIKNKSLKKYVPKKNSDIHFLINTEEKKKLMQKAKEEGIPFAEWCRRKIKENSQLNRIENKIDRLINKN